MTPEQMQAIQGISGTAGSNNAMLGDAAGSLLGLATGQTQQGNWDAIATDTMQRIMPGINSSFAGSGMTGSTLHQQNLSQGLSQGMGSPNKPVDASIATILNAVVAGQLISRATLAAALTALQAENQRLREALAGLELACDQLAATRTREVYLAMIDSGQQAALLFLDSHRGSARAALRSTREGG